MKKIIIWVALAAVAGLTVYNTFTLGRVRSHQTEAIILQPVNEPVEQPHASPSERIIEFTGFDYSENLFVSNKLHLDPIVAVSNVKLGADIGDIWNDAVGSALRYNDGNTPVGLKFAFARFGTDVITIRATANDTIDFPELFSDHATVNYTLNTDTVNGTTASITLLETYNSDSAYVNMNSSVFPYIFNEGVERIVDGGTLKFNRAIFLIGDADTVSMTITRDFDLGQ